LGREAEKGNGRGSGGKKSTMINGPCGRGKGGPGKAEGKGGGARTKKEEVMLEQKKGERQRL